jgi:hypothetical protein
MQRGDIMKLMGVVPGAPITDAMSRDMAQVWMEVYLTFMLLKSHNPEEQKKLDQVQLKLAEANELIMQLERKG